MHEKYERMCPKVLRYTKKLFKRCYFTAALIGLGTLVGCQSSKPTSKNIPTVSTAPTNGKYTFMISAANPIAANVGHEILRAGGSSIDAAIATQMTLNLVEPQSSGIGGGGFLMYYDSNSGSIESFDGRETAPLSTSPEIFLSENGRPMPFYSAAIGGLGVGIPGLLRMLEKVHLKHGKLPWSDLFKPAIKLSKQGFPISSRLSKLISKDKFLRESPTTRKYFSHS